jgi:hypothetical protein
VLERAPDRTEADLYLWLVEHLQEVSRLYGEEAPTRTFSDALVDFLAERGQEVPADLLVEDDPSVTLSRAEIMAAVEEKKREEETTQ